MNPSATRRRDDQLAVARGLGRFSIALGATELVAPQAIARWLGMRGGEALLQTSGAREIGTGIGIFASNDPTAWLWGRVGGDLLISLRSRADCIMTITKRATSAWPWRPFVGVTVLDAACASALSHSNAQLQNSRNAAIRSYAAASGFPAPPEKMRGAARDFKVPDDMRTPVLLRPFALRMRGSSPRPGSSGIRGAQGQSVTAHLLKSAAVL